MQSEEFAPKDALDAMQLKALEEGKVAKLAGNTNFAFNANDKTAVRKKM
jgi:hypothetical protein